MNLDNMKISTRLAAAFAAMTVLMALLGGISIYRTTGIQGQFGVVMESSYPKISMAQDIKAVNSEVSLAIRDLFILTDPAAIAARFETIDTVSKRTGGNVDKLKASITSEQGKAALAKLLQARADYREPRERVLGLLRDRNLEGARVALNEVLPRQDAYMAAADALIDVQEGVMDASAQAVEASAARSKYTIASLIAGSLVLAIVLALWIIRSITRPLGEAVRITQAVARGDLSMEFKADGKSETGLLLGALHDMKTRLAGIVADVRGNAEGVATASEQIAQGNNDLSGRTEEQASALEETAASMEELSSTVKQNADNALQGNQLAQGASTVAAKGGAVVSQVVDTMAGINESSKKIADIISVIDGIAFQTNILALNAAVEAARAGEQGRGFAVVASEVRNLAQRSAEAAKEIKGLITASVERVEQGSALVDQAGATMTEVVTAIKRVTDIMGEISSASTEQSAGVAQIGEAVQQMDQATQQNAALVEESAAAAESLKVQAQHLVNAVAVFKLAQGQQARAVAATPAKPATKPATGWNGAERRGPDRAKNVSRLPTRPAAAKPPAEPALAPATAAKTGTDDWQSF